MTWRSLVWRELLAGYDVADIATLVFRDQSGCWGFLDLWRSAGDASFDAEELGLLARMTVPITAALRRSLAATFEARPDLDSIPAGPAVLLLSPTLDVLTQTAETVEYLRLLVPPTGGESPVPAAAYNVGDQLLACEAGVDEHPPSARMHLRDNIWLTCRAARIGHDRPVDERDIAVTIEKTPPAARISLFSKAFGLTVREEQLVGQVVGGGTTKEIAARMFVSPLTVQDHLKSVFAKTATRTRLQLTSRALGT